MFGVEIWFFPEQRQIDSELHLLQSLDTSDIHKPANQSMALYDLSEKLICFLKVYTIYVPSNILQDSKERNTV